LTCNSSRRFYDTFRANLRLLNQTCFKLFLSKFTRCTDEARWFLPDLGDRHIRVYFNLFLHTLIRLLHELHGSDTGLTGNFLGLSWFGCEIHLDHFITLTITFLALLFTLIGLSQLLHILYSFLSQTIFTHFDVAVRAARLAVWAYLLGALRQCLSIEHGLVIGVPSLLIVHIAESFQIFSVFCSSTVPHPQPLFDLLQFNFLLVSFRCFRVHLHHILLQFFLLALTILFLKLVVELWLDFGDASILEFLPEKQSFESCHLSVFLRELLGVQGAFQSLNLLFLNIWFSLQSLSFQLIVYLLFQCRLWLRVIGCDLSCGLKLDAAPMQNLISLREVCLHLLAGLLDLR